MEREAQLGFFGENLDGHTGFVVHHGAADAPVMMPRPAQSSNPNLKP